MSESSSSSNSTITDKSCDFVGINENIPRPQERFPEKYV